MEPAPQQDVSHLVSAAFRTGMDLLIREGASRPFGMFLDLDGVIRVRNILRATGEDDAELTWRVAESLYDDAVDLLVALVIEHTGDPALPVMRGYGDHRHAIEFSFFIQWQMDPASGIRPVALDIEPSHGSIFR